MGPARPVKAQVQTGGKAVAAPGKVVRDKNLIKAMEKTREPEEVKAAEKDKELEKIYLACKI